MRRRAADRRRCRIGTIRPDPRIVAPAMWRTRTSGYGSGLTTISCSPTTRSIKSATRCRPEPTSTSGQRRGGRRGGVLLAGAPRRTAPAAPLPESRCRRTRTSARPPMLPSRFGRSTCSTAAVGSAYSRIARLHQQSARRSQRQRQGDRETGPTSRSVATPRRRWPPRRSTLRATTSRPTPRPETSVTLLLVEKPGRKMSRKTSRSCMTARSASVARPRSAAAWRTAATADPRTVVLHLDDRGVAALRRGDDDAANRRLTEPLALRG